MVSFRESQQPNGRRVLSLPSRARLMAVAVSLPELWRTRARLGSVEGFDLDPANRLLGAVGSKESDGGHGLGNLPVVLPYPIWQCGGAYRELSQRAALLDFDFSSPMLSGDGVVTLECPALDGAGPPREISHHSIHAVVLWMDYGLDDVSARGDVFQVDDKFGGCWLSDQPDWTGLPKPSHQGVMLLQRPVTVVKATKNLRIKSSFSAHNGDIEFSVLEV